MDILTKEKRSWNMSKIKGKNTKPEITVRSILHKAGYRFRVHVNKLLGKPDIVLSKYRSVIFVHGCFWHRHRRCKFAYSPKTKQQFWMNKFKENINRHKKVTRELKKLGWRVIVIWECEASNTDKILNSII